MGNINKPSEKKYWIAHNDDDFIVTGETDPGLVTDSGQPYFEIFDSENQRDARAKLLANEMVARKPNGQLRRDHIAKLTDYNGDISKWDVPDTKTNSLK